MTQVIKYHTKTNELALFKSGKDYWIGSYYPWSTHQTDEPAYLFYDGVFGSEEEGIEALDALNGDEF